MLRVRKAVRVALELGVMQKADELVGLCGDVAELTPEVMVEIGSAGGGTLSCWCEMADPHALVISVDLPGGPFSGGVDSLALEELFRGFPRGRQRLELVRGDSHSQEVFDRVVAALGGKPVDFLFIDGDHTYDGVKADWEMYSPLVRPGGLVALHDIAVHPVELGCDVDVFWKELTDALPDGSWWEHREPSSPDWAGIGVVRV